MANGQSAYQAIFGSTVVLMLLVGGYTMGKEQDYRQAILKEYKGDVRLPEALLTAYAKFAQLAVTSRPEDLLDQCLPQSVTISADKRAGANPEYGQEMNLPFLKSNFKPQILSVRKENDDSFLIRTATSAMWFVNTKSLGWKMYRYLDKPIE